VIGTSHFRCDSYIEVSDLIRRVNPDGVVIELDPERLLRLTLDDASMRAATAETTRTGAMEVIGKRWFGGDFLSAIETSKELDIPIFLGDEYPIETKKRFIDTLFDATSYNPQKLLAGAQSMFRTRLNRTTNSNSEILFVGVLGTFLEDPRKLLPLAATLSLPFLTVVISLVLDATSATATEVMSREGLLLDYYFEIFSTLLSLLVSFFTSCKVFNNLIVDRDVVVASNAQRAATTIFLLKSNQLIRKRWTFTVNEKEDVYPPEQMSVKPKKAFSKEIPLFTLKNPLEQSAIRNLNLFEPRWLKMIDRLLLSNPEQQQHPNGAEWNPRTQTGELPIIGCVTCTNKFYSAINLIEASQSINPMSFVEGRYADVIFRRVGRFGELNGVTEGSRPSGARKVGAKIIGKESFDLSLSKDSDGNDGISVTPEGYLTASNLIPINEYETAPNVEVMDSPNEINIVVVVGLLHANGVLESLSRSHESTATVER